MSRRSGRLSRRGQKPSRKESKLERVREYLDEHPAILRKLSYAGGVATLASIPLTVFYPIIGLSIMQAGGVTSVFGHYGIRKRKGKFEHVKLPMTKDELRLLAQRFKKEKEAKKRGKKK